MDTNTSTQASFTSGPRNPLPWLLIIGLTSLALLWPITALWQLGSGLTRAIGIFGITAVVWVATVGFGRVRRPVLTLTIAGFLHALVAFLLSGYLSGVDGPLGDSVALWVSVASLAASTGIGALLGLAAWGVQRGLQRRAGARAGAES